MTAFLPVAFWPLLHSASPGPGERRYLIRNILFLMAFSERLP
jgi:hypothetical protein